jgi:hypothetical protein
MRNYDVQSVLQQDPSLAVQLPAEHVDDEQDVYEGMGAGVGVGVGVGYNGASNGAGAGNGAGVGNVKLEVKEREREREKEREREQREQREQRVHREKEREKVKERERVADVPKTETETETEPMPMPMDLPSVAVAVGGDGPQPIDPPSTTYATYQHSGLPILLTHILTRDDILDVLGQGQGQGGVASPTSVRAILQRVWGYLSSMDESGGSIFAVVVSYKLSALTHTHFYI